METVITDLSTTLNYQHPELIARFCDEYAISEAEAQEIFLETKRWLWLCAKNHVSNKSALPLFDEAQVIDMMWHQFLMFTKDYADFCQKYFGAFVHHVPLTRTEKQARDKAFAENPDKATAERLQILEGVYETIYDELGAETLIRWCEEFPAKYGQDRFI